MNRKISKRRMTAVVISILLIVLIAILTTDKANAYDGFIYGLLLMFFLGIFQLLSAVAGLIKGSKLQGLYLVASIIYLVIYISSVMDYIDLPNVGIDEEYLAVISALVMATIYTIILVVDPTPSDVPEQAKDDLLDDWN